MKNKETLEEAVERIVKSKVGLHYFGNENSLENLAKKEYIIEGAKWQQEQDKNKYSEEDMRSAFNVGFNVGYNDETSPSYLTFEKWINGFKKKENE